MRDIVSAIFDIIVFLIFIRILLSWLPMIGVRIDEYNPIVRYLVQFTDIFLEPFRRLIPPIGGLDFSPIIALLVLQLIAQLIIRSLPY